MRKLLISVFLSLSLLTVTSAFISPSVSVINNKIRLNFPESATFRATLSGDVDITSVVLEYGNKQESCGEVIAKAFPQFTLGKTVNAEWTWEMRQSGSLPPGSQVWWRWRITDVNGQETVTQIETTTWLDDVHDWQTMTQEDFLHLHWYEGNQSFAAELAKAAQDGLLFNQTQSGLKVEAPIDIYVYANTNDLKEAILYEPSWIGGGAFPDYDIVILAISPNELEWGRDVIVHELTHVLIGHLTFSCLGDVPTWLNEGLAVYSEGDLNPGWQQQLDDAIREDTLFTVRSLSSGFSEDRTKALLSYSQSYSVTQFLVETYGQEKMTALLLALQEGVTIDEALQQTYGFNTEGLEAAWRRAIGAQPRPVSEQATAQPTPTFVPTIIPVRGVSSALQVTSTPVPTSSLGSQPTETSTPTGPPLALTMILLGMCCIFVVLIGVVVLGFVVRGRNRKGGDNVQ
jgi:hypothetical protein